MPQPLQELLRTRQALEIIPGVLYFASLGEKLQSIRGHGAATTSSSSALASRAALAASTAEFLEGQRQTPQEEEGGHRESLRGLPPTAHTNVCCMRSDVTRSVLLRQVLQLDNNSDGTYGGEFAHGAFYFSVNEDPSFQYRPFFADFGPLGLDAVTRFSRCLERLLECCVAYGGSANSNRRTEFGPHKFLSGNGLWHRRLSAPPSLPIVFCSGLDNHERANAACLLACFCVATLRWSAAATWRVFESLYPPIIPFRDASCSMSMFPLVISDVIAGLEKAIALGWYDVCTFDLAEYERLQRYNCSWVVPHAFLALSSPDNHVPERTAEVYAKLFQKLKITHLVRLNESLYRRETFLANGVQHFDLLYADGSVPTDDIINRFLNLVEPVLLPLQRAKSELERRVRTAPPLQRRQKGTRLRQQADARAHGRGGAVALHCRAGLGRTGTLICVYMMRHFGLTARESIGWIRLCRPGSVMGVQQGFLERLERRLSRPVRDAEMLCAEQSIQVCFFCPADASSNCTCQIHTPQQVSVTPPSPWHLAADVEETPGDTASAPPGHPRMSSDERRLPAGGEEALLVLPRTLRSLRLSSPLCLTAMSTIPRRRQENREVNTEGQAAETGGMKGRHNSYTGVSSSPLLPLSPLHSAVFTPRNLPSTRAASFTAPNINAGERPPQLLKGGHRHAQDAAVRASGNHDISSVDNGRLLRRPTGAETLVGNSSNFRISPVNGTTARDLCVSTALAASVESTPSVAPQMQTKRLIIVARKAAAAAAAEASLTDPGWGAVAVRLEP
ncbi:tyrosine phosphatase [Trypanosoma rangeli]|uniref:Tyrosine phosphatase n=1 Tax=Trypanosoma rangeli TaxID=5698 RepID=A0A3R7KKN3_TRYRA|nr:tyrosine phosphatase [Trypanosoma rangeli]RNF09366.1 tyrosine phosphatase [Trypanosoma rangeli]|eukprot:RNF09366.1 tyrosine phosphatase [Trypanosoma rangeli]